MPIIAIIIGVVIAAIDQLIKLLVNTNLKPVGSVDVLGDVVKLTYVENRGVAFGMFQGMQWLFAVFTFVMLGAIIFLMFKRRPKSKFFYVSAALIIGGGIGNLIDRIFYGYVIDYISLSFFPPVCNFADYCITIGVFMLAIYMLFFTDKTRKSMKDSQDDTA